MGALLMALTWRDSPYQPTSLRLENSPSEAGHNAEEIGSSGVSRILRMTTSLTVMTRGVPR
jgi:hypothetical protein